MVIMSNNNEDQSSLSPLPSACLGNDHPKKPPILKPKPKDLSAINHLVNNVNDILTNESNNHNLNFDDNRDRLSQQPINGNKDNERSLPSLDNHELNGNDTGEQLNPVNEISIKQSSPTNDLRPSSSDSPTTRSKPVIAPKPKSLLTRSPGHKPHVPPKPPQVKISSPPCFEDHHHPHTTLFTTSSSPPTSIRTSHAEDSSTTDSQPPSLASSVSDIIKNFECNQPQQNQPTTIKTTTEFEPNPEVIKEEVVIPENPDATRKSSSLSPPLIHEEPPSDISDEISVSSLDISCKNGGASSNSINSSTCSGLNLLSLPDHHSSTMTVSSVCSEGPDDLGTSVISDEERRRLKRANELCRIAEELTTTEETFVQKLKLLDVDFRKKALLHLPEDIVSGQLIPHISQLHALNEQLLSELKRHLRDYKSKRVIAVVFVEMGPYLKQYSLFMKDFNSITEAFVTAKQRYPSFAAELERFECEKFQKFNVQAILLEPVQRIPRYRLLMETYLKHMEPDHPDFENAQRALQVVSTVADHANNTVREGDSFLRLYNIQENMLVRRELIKPGRVLLREGDLFKQSRKELQERRFVLCSDCLFYMTLVQGAYRFHHELSLTGMRVQKTESHDFDKEIQIYARARSLTLVANDTKERDEWYEALTKAIDANALRRMTFNGVVTGRPVSAASSNSYRRHHCRCCGKVVCNPCSPNKAPLKYLNFRADRVCNECYDKLKSQFEMLMEASGKTSRRKSSTFYTQEPPPPVEAMPSLTVSDIGGECDNASGNFSVDGGDVGNFVTIETAAGVPEESETAHDVDVVNYEKLMAQYFQRDFPIRVSARKKKVPNVLTQVAANDHGSSMSGYLHMRKSKNSWKRQWFVIKEKVIYAYRASEDVRALSSTPLLGWEAKRLDKPIDGVEGSNLLELVHPGQPHMIFKIESTQTRDRWFQAMRAATVLDEN